MSEARDALRLKRLVEENPDLLCVLGRDGYLKMVNARWTELLGWTAQELLAEPFIDFVHPDDIQDTYAGAADAVEGETFGFENRFRTRAGQWVWLQWQVRFDPALGEILGAVRAVTSAKRQRQMVERSLDLLCVVDLEGTFLALSPRWTEVLGVEREAMLGRPFWEFCHPDDVGKTIREVKRLESGEISDSIGFENRYQRADGTWVTFEWNSTIDPQLGELISVARDVTEARRISNELARAKEAAEVANLAKSRFVANMSHELRTPLNSVLGFAAILRDSEADAGRADLLDRIRASGLHLLSVIDDLLDHAMIEAGRFDLEASEVDVSELVAEVVGLLTVQAVPKGLVVDLVDEGGAGIIEANARGVRQALLNLIGNAIKFTKQGGVQIRVVRDELGPLRVEVSDSAAGIAEDMLALVFEEFRQVDETQQRAHSGTGLGLPIARRLARGMGFEVTVSSTPGLGSTFCLLFRGEAPLRHVPPALAST